MLRFLTYRILAAIPVLLVMSIVTFGIIHATPGDYADYVAQMLRVQGHASNDIAMAAAKQFRIDHGLNDPLVIQYFRWIKGMFVGDFGQSYFYNRPISEVVWQRLPPTIAIALTCHFLASFIGIGLGILAATRQYSWVDTLLSILAFLGMTLPRFLMALIIIYILAFKLNVQELGSFYSTYWSYQPMSFGKLAYNMRVMRGNLLDTLNAQYVETARAKGLSNSATIMKHAVPNAIHPLVAYQGVILPYMMQGEIETAIIFGIPTVGPAIVDSMSIGDVLVTATFLLILGSTLIVGGIISDLLLAWLDPRIRLGGEA